MGSDNPQQSAVRFGAFCFDLDSLELSRRGQLLRLQRQPAQVLACLLRRPGKLVSRQELAEHLWGGTFVDTDQGLNNAVRHLRKVLADSAESPLYIETVPRLGYRFIAPLAGQSDFGPPPSRLPARAWLGLVGAAGLGLAAWLLMHLPAENLPTANSGPAVHLLDERGPADSKAREAFVQARQAMKKGDLASLRTSLNKFEEAARLAPDYAPAQLGLAWASWLSEADSSQRRQVALQHSLKALRMADSPEAHLLRAEIAFYHEWDKSLAQKHYREALIAGGGLKEVHASFALFAALTGELETARRHAEMSLDLDPSSALSNLSAGMTYLLAGEPERAVGLCRRALSLGAGSGAESCVLAVQLARGDLEGALQAVAEWMPSTDPPPEVMQRIESAPSRQAVLNRYLRWRFHLLFVAVRQPFTAGAEGPEADQQRPVWASAMGELWSSPGRVAMAAAEAGGEAAALEWLQRAHAERSPSFVRWAVSPAFAGLREQAEFQRLLAQSPLRATESQSHREQN